MSLPEWIITHDGRGRRFVAHTTPPHCFIAEWSESKRELPGAMRLPSGLCFRDLIVWGEELRPGGVYNLLSDAEQAIRRWALEQKRKPPRNWPETVRAIRRAAGYSRTELGKVLGYSYFTVRSWEVGERTPGDDSGERILREAKRWGIP